MYLSRFVCIANLNVIPKADVGKVQNEVSGILENDYSNKYCNLYTDPDSIFIYPLGKSTSESRITHNVNGRQTHYNLKNTF